MAYLLAKIFVFLCVASIAVSQSTVTVINPDPSWSTYQLKQCCPSGFNIFGNYCIQCAEPLFWDAISGRCASCPSDHIYNPTSKRCECTIPCDAPRQYNPSTRQCECTPDSKGTRRIWSETNKTCQCPPELPLFNGKYCVVCPTGTEYDPKEKQCYHCPEGFIRDAGSHNCVPGLWSIDQFIRI